MRAEIVITKYILINSMLVEAIIAIAAPNVLAISKRVRGVAVE